jgi:hypothetical protein
MYPGRGCDLMTGMGSRSTDRQLAAHKSQQITEGTKPGPGWYHDKRWPGEQRRWDGAGWIDQWRPVASPWPQSPAGFMWIGAGLAIILGLVAGAAFEVSETAGWIVLSVASAIAGTVFNIGMIGKAVEIGVRAARR